MNPIGLAAMVRLRPLAAAVLFLLAPAAFAHAQVEFSPPSGKGRVVVVLSGIDGAGPYSTVTAQIAQLGYDAVLFDSNAIFVSRNRKANLAGVKADIDQALKMPHALPGPAALVGLSLGGGLALDYSTQVPDPIVGEVLWYPVTQQIKDVPEFIREMKVPVLMFAGELDNFRGCCIIGKARELAAAAAAAGKPFELVTYPNTNHSFIYGENNYNPEAYKDAFPRMATRLKDYFAN